jgi:hypothetical protein
VLVDQRGYDGACSLIFGPCTTPHSDSHTLASSTPCACERFAQARASGLITCSTISRPSVTSCCAELPRSHRNFVFVLYSCRTRGKFRRRIPVRLRTFFRGHHTIREHAAIPDKRLGIRYVYILPLSDLVKSGRKWLLIHSRSVPFCNRKKV